MPLRKYDNLLRDIWAILDKPVGEKPTIRIPAGATRRSSVAPCATFSRRRSTTSTTMPFRKVRLATIAAIKDLGTAKNNPRPTSRRFKLSSPMRSTWPSLPRCWPRLKASSKKAPTRHWNQSSRRRRIILLALTTPALEQLPTALNTYIVRTPMKQAESVLASEFDEKESKKRLLEYFEDLGLGRRLAQELRDITNHDAHGWPGPAALPVCLRHPLWPQRLPDVLYPATISFDELNGDMVLTLNPHL